MTIVDENAIGNSAYADTLQTRAQIRKLLIKGAGWQFVLRISGRLLNVIKNVALARLLAPADIGTMGIALICLGAVDKITYLSIHNILLWKAEARHAYTTSAFLVNILRGLILSLFLFILAEPLGRLFQNDSVIPLIRAIALLPLIDAFVNPCLADLRYELDFQKLGVYEFLVDFLTLIITLSLAWRLRSPWAIALGMISGQIFAVIISYTLVRFRATSSWSWGKIREIIEYGKWVSANGGVQYIASQFDSIVIARMMGATDLGYYQMADRFSRTILNDLTMILLRLTTPAFSRLQKDVAGRRVLALRSIGLLAYALFPVVVMLLVAGDYMLGWVLGSEWLPAIPILKILAVGGVLFAVQTMGGPIFYALGVPEEDFRIYAIRAITMIVFSVPFVIVWGATGAAFAVLFSSAVMFPMWYHQLRKYAAITLGQIVRELAIPLIICLGLGVLMLIGIRLIGQDIWVIFSVVVLSVALYGLMLLILARSFNIGPLNWLFRVGRKQ